MPHEVESMMYTGVPPWHRLGVRVEGELTSREAIEKAGLDWESLLRPIFAAISTVGPGDGSVKACEVPGYRAVVRSTDTKILGVVGERYRPINNRDAFTFFDEVVGQGHAVYETAGSLDGGKRIWILARLTEEIRIGRDDVVRPYLLLASSHDGSSSLRMLPTPVRVVCQNTLNIALDDGSGEGISVRHTATAPARLEQAIRVMRVATRYYQEFETEAERLMASRFTDLQMKQLAVSLFPDRNDEPSPRRGRAREKVIELFTEGMEHRPIEGTAWAALNAVAEYADHHRTVRTKDAASKAEARMSAAWFGTGASLKRQAHEAINHQLAA